MFVYDFTYIDQPVAVVRSRLTSDPISWLSALATGARADEERLLMRVGPLGAGPLLSRTVRVTCGDLLDRRDRVTMPITWQADHLTGAFPVLEADLEVAPLGDHRTQVTLMGRYEPPLGPFGKGLDRLLLHRVAQASVRAFLTRLGDSLAEHALRDELTTSPASA